MAGTRLIIQLTFLIEIIILILLALHIETRNDSLINHIEKKFFPRREGHDELQSLYFQSELFNSKDALALAKIPISIKLFVLIPTSSSINISSKNNDKSYISVNHSNLDNEYLQNLSAQFESYMNENTPSIIKPQITETKIIHFDEVNQRINGDSNIQTSFVDCDSLNTTFLFERKDLFATPHNKQTTTIINNNDDNHSYVYPIYFAFGCADKLVEIDSTELENKNKKQIQRKIHVHESGLVYIPITTNDNGDKNTKTSSISTTTKNKEVPVNLEALLEPHFHFMTKYAVQSISKAIFSLPNNRKSPLNVSPQAKTPSSTSKSDNFMIKPSYHITITLLDQDPSSSPHHMLGQYMSNSIDQMLRPFLHRISQQSSQLISFQIKSRTVAYAGNNFPKETKQSIPMHIMKDYMNHIVYNHSETSTSSSTLDSFTISSSSLLEWFESDFLIRSPDRYSFSLSSPLSSATNTCEGLDSSSQTTSSFCYPHETPTQSFTNLNYVIIVPSLKYSPMMIMKKDKQNRKKRSNEKTTHNDIGQSYHVVGKGGISITNIHHNQNSKIKPDDFSTTALTESMKFEIDNAISIFASQIRNEIGLDYIPPHQQDRVREKSLSTSLPMQSSSNSITTIHDHSDKGASQWELQMMMMYWIPIRFNHLLEIIESILSVLNTRTGIEISQKLYMNIFKSIHLLKDTYNQILEYNFSSDIVKRLNLAEHMIYIALYESSMMEHTFIPRDHLMAILSPLLLPIAFPVLVGAIREWKRYKELALKRSDVKI